MASLLSLPQCVNPNGQHASTDAMFSGACHLVAIPGTTTLVPYPVVKSLQLIWGSGTIGVWSSKELQWLNSLIPGRSGCNIKNVIFNLVLLIGLVRFADGNALRWMPEKLTDDKSTLVQVMAWCRQATSHYLSQVWLSSLSPCGVTRPHWVKDRAPG